MPNPHTKKEGAGPFGAAVWGGILLTVAATPLLFAPGMRDAFRVPKAIFLEAMMLLVAAVMTAGLLLRERPELSERMGRHRVPILLATAAVAWTALVSMTAVQPAVSRFAPLTAFCYAILFIVTLLFARGTVLPLAALFAPAAVNAIVALPQALHGWSPIRLERVPPGRANVMGLLGNPDYVGAFLIVPCVVAIAGALAFRRKRIVFIPIAALLLGGLLLTQSITAAGAIGAAIFSFVIVIRSRRLQLAIVTLILAMVTFQLAYPPMRERTVDLLLHLRQGRFDDFTSLRLSPFAVAVDMFRQHPLVGVGPGGFEAGYMSTKLELDERYPQWSRLVNENFGEVHNDHLQLLAESGLPGYLLFLAGLVHLAAISFRRSPPESERGELARLFALPAAVGFGVVALGQFPLYLPSAMSGALFAAALAHVWSSDASD